MTAPVVTPAKPRAAERAQAPVRRTPVVWHLSEVAETIRSEALGLARRTVSNVPAAAPAQVLLLQPRFRAAFKAGLAASVAQVLGANDDRLLAVYTYDQEDPVLHLLVLVTQPSAALTAFVAALDRALTADLHALGPTGFADRDSILDVNLITPKEVRLGLGYAVLLSAVSAAPLKVWTRER